MSIDYKDLNPVEATAVINNQSLEFNKFSLMAQCWADKEFATADEPSGVIVLSGLIQDWTQPEPMLKLSYYLLKDKSLFKSFQEYLEFVDSHKSKWTNVKAIYEAVVYTLGVSQPQIDEMEEELELKKSLAVGS
jgi:hypothetical protein